jgi:serine phosphatase RsbU (regulator of sigma subunit)
VATEGERELEIAAALGREAVAERLSVLELADVHHRALVAELTPLPSSAECVLLGELAADFLREALSAFDSGYRGALEARETARTEHEHAEQLHALTEISAALRASLPVDEILTSIAREARRILGARSVVARLNPPDGAGDPLEAVAGDRGEQPAGVVPAPESTGPLTGGAVPLRLVAPITGRRGLVVGTLEASFPGPRRFGAHRLITQLAQITSAAVLDAQLLAREREIAVTLQRSLLPESLPEIGGADLAARHCAAGDGMVVGGDFYDAFRARDGRWAVAIGDVCGKGPEAAALTALVRYTLRAAALSEEDPARVLGLVNDAILDQRADHRFCTALYALLTPHSGGLRAELVTGGHPLPLALRRDGRVETTGRHGTLLGIAADAELARWTVELEPGDLLLLYTDGATEVRGDGRLVFGGRELRATLAALAGRSAGETADAIEQAVLDASGGRARDDLALVAVRAAG